MFSLQLRCRQTKFGWYLSTISQAVKLCVGLFLPDSFQHRFAQARFKVFRHNIEMFIAICHSTVRAGDLQGTDTITRLSLSMVTSPQSPLPFRPAISL